MKKILVLLLVLAIIGAGLSLLKRFAPSFARLPNGPRPPVAVSEEKPDLVLGSLSLPLDSGLAASHEDNYVEVTVDLDDPGPGNLRLVGEYVNEVLATYAEAFDSGSFTAVQKRVMDGSAAGAYTLDIEGEKTEGEGGRWSYRLEVSSYTGGAHGSYAVVARTFDDDGNALTLAEVTGLTNPLPVISDLAKPILVDMITTYMRQNGSEAPYEPDEEFQGGTAPTPENYASWYVEGKDLVVVFGQYQIGPYALGHYEVPVPLAEIRAGR